VCIGKRKMLPLEMLPLMVLLRSSVGSHARPCAVRSLRGRLLGIVPRDWPKIIREHLAA
jgi:hypothetical protein